MLIQPEEISDCSIASCTSDEPTSVVPPDLEAPSSWKIALKRIRQVISLSSHSSTLIGIDGIDGSGKTSLAHWLGWQTSSHVLHLDFYIEPHEASLRWQTEEIDRIIKSQRTLIIEGICLLDVLKKAGHRPDIHVFISRHENEISPGPAASMIRSYFRSRKPRQNASIYVKWSSKEYERRNLQKVRAAAGGCLAKPS